MSFLLTSTLILLKSLSSTSLINRLVNRYTTHGIIIVVMQLETLGILPKRLSQSIDGLPASEIATYLTLAVGIYFIFHMPKFKSKLDKAKYNLELTKTELELEQVKRELALVQTKQELPEYNNASPNTNTLK